MRILSGIILGAMLTVGGAWLIDMSTPADGDMINWKIAGERLQSFGQLAGDKIGGLFGS